MTTPTPTPTQLATLQNAAACGGRIPRGRTREDVLGRMYDAGWIGGGRRLTEAGYRAAGRPDLLPGVEKIEARELFTRDTAGAFTSDAQALAAVGRQIVWTVPCEPGREWADGYRAGTVRAVESAGSALLVHLYEKVLIPDLGYIKGRRTHIIEFASDAPLTLCPADVANCEHCYTVRDSCPTCDAGKPDGPVGNCRLCSIYTPTNRVSVVRARARVTVLAADQAAAARQAEPVSVPEPASASWDDLVTETDDDAVGGLLGDEVVIGISVSASPTSTTIAIPRDVWDAMSPVERTLHCDELADGEMSSAGGYGWGIESGASEDEIGLTPLKIDTYHIGLTLADLHDEQETPSSFQSDTYEAGWHAALRAVRDRLNIPRTTTPNGGTPVPEPTTTVTYGPIDKAAILATRVDSLLNSGAVDGAPAAGAEVAALSEIDVTDAGVEAYAAAVEPLREPTRALLTLVKVDAVQDVRQHSRRELFDTLVRISEGMTRVVLAEAITCGAVVPDSTDVVTLEGPDQDGNWTWRAGENEGTFDADDVVAEALRHGPISPTSPLPPVIPLDDFDRWDADEDRELVGELLEMFADPRASLVELVHDVAFEIARMRGQVEDDEDVADDEVTPHDITVSIVAMLPEDGWPEPMPRSTGDDPA